MSAHPASHHKCLKTEPQHLPASGTSTEHLVASTGRWIEKCTGYPQGTKTSVEYLGDGTLLCILIQNLVPGMIRKVNRIKSPFAWRENIIFFLSACSKLGLSEGQLFSVEDLITTTSSSTATLYKAKGSLPGSEHSRRQVSLTLYYLALQLECRPGYTGPRIQLGQEIHSTLQFSSEVLPEPNEVPRHHPEELGHLSSLDLTPIATSSSCSSPIVQSPSGIRTRRVESVTHLTTETRCTDIQSYAEVVLYLNGSNKEYTAIDNPGPVRLTQGFRQPGYCSSRSYAVQRTLSDCTPAVSENPSLKSVPDNTCASGLQRNFGISCSQEEVRRGSWSTLEDCRKRNSTPSPSGTSSAIRRAVPSSLRWNTSAATSKDYVASSQKERNLEASTERFPHSRKDFPGRINSTKDCSTVAREEEIHRNSTLVSPGSLKHLAKLERDLANLLSLDIGRCDVESQSAQRDCGTREEVTVTSKLEATATGKVRDLVKRKSSATDFDLVEARLSAGSSPTFGVIRTLNTESTSLKDIAITGRRNRHRSPLNVERSYYDCFSKQVTDIHEKRKESTEHIFCPVSDSLHKRTAKADRAMDVHTQHGSSHVFDSEPVSLSGIKMRGYPSNSPSKEMGPITSSAMVPHHSLSLTISDPESPSSCKMLESSSGESRVPLSNFDLPPQTTTKLNPVPPVPASSLDMSRVRSDALPQSSLPSMTTITDGREARLAPPRLTADARSIDTSSIDDMDSVSVDDNEGLFPPREPAIMEAQVHGRKHTEQREREAVVGGRKDFQQPQGRPNGVPHKSSSFTLSPTSMALSTATPSPSISTAPTATNEKRKSLGFERKRRMANIQENARTALQYSSNWKSGKSDSLPRDARGSSVTCSTVSTGSEDGEDNAVSTVSLTTNTTTTTSNVTSPSSSGAGTASTPLNLHHLSIEQTKQASVTQMYEIWKEVEAIGSQSGETQDSLDTQPVGPSSSLTAAPTVGVELGDMRVAEQRNLDVHSASSDMSTEGSEKRVSRVTGEGDAVIANQKTVEVQAVAPNNASKKKLNKSNSFSNRDIDSLLDTLKSLSRHGEGEDLKILEDMLKSNTFKHAKRAHDNMLNLLSGSIVPAATRVLPSTQMMREHLRHHTEPSPEVDELRVLLRAPDIQALLFCHDKVSTHDLYVPAANFHRTTLDPVDIIQSPSVDNFHTYRASSASRHAASSRDVPSNRKEGATIVYLERTNRPLGCTIYKQDDSVFIGKLLRGCDAGASDMLCEGDELLEVNGIPVAGMRTEDIIHLMSGDVASGSTLAFTIIPVHDESYDVDFEPKYLRAHFNYDGSRDAEVPCKALALFFQKGDIMEVVHQDDPNWWQACKVFEEGAVSLPGLMPSMHLQQMREAMVHSHPYYSAMTTKKGLRGLFFKKKKKTVYYQNTPPRNALGIGDEIPTYEEVVKMDPDPSMCRPIVLVGAPGVGRKTLIRKLIESDPSLYQPVVQHTTRGVRAGESRDFYFVSREEFERDIEQDRFLEYGESKGHFSGISFSSIKRVMESGRIPVMDVHPQALKKIRHTGLKPFVVFVASPELERLQVTRRLGSQKQKKRLSLKQHLHLPDMAHIYTEADLHHLVKESYLIETQYGHYFDWVMVNDDFRVAADMLKEVARRLEHEPQWVPAAWKNY